MMAFMDESEDLIVLLLVVSGGRGTRSLRRGRQRRSDHCSNLRCLLCGVEAEDYINSPSKIVRWGRPGLCPTPVAA